MALRDELWNSVLDADMNVRYYGNLTRRYHLRELWFKIFIAIMTSSAVAGWGLLLHIDWLWKALSALSALFAIALPILNYQATIELSVNTTRGWLDLKNRYEQLWLQLPSSAINSLQVKFSEIKKDEVITKTGEAKLPIDSKLIRKCFEEVITSRGLKK